MLIYFRQKIETLFKGKTSSVSKQLFRYIFTGGLAFIVDFEILFLLTECFYVHYLISACVAFLFGLLVNYFLSIRWVFNSRVVENRLLEFSLFTTVGLLALGINELFLWIFTDVLGNHYLFSKIITAIIIFFWNFFGRKLILFSEMNKHQRI